MGKFSVFIGSVGAPKQDKGTMYIKEECLDSDEVLKQDKGTSCTIEYDEGTSCIKEECLGSDEVINQDKGTSCEFSDDDEVEGSLSTTLGLTHDAKLTAYICNLCWKKFDSSEVLVQHLKFDHYCFYICSQCCKGFEDFKSYNDHQKVHKLFNCEKCSFVAKRESRLKQHQASHTKERPYVCMVCGKSYKHKFTLNDHQKTHFKSLKQKTCASPENKNM